MQTRSDNQAMSLKRACALIDGGARVLPTNLAAALLNRRPGTLHRWACSGKGPVLPVRVNGRLGWPVEAIRRELNAAPSPTPAQAAGLI